MTREEAINTVRNIYQTDKEKEALEILIPELAESDDERIINAIISFLRMTSLYSSNGCKKPEMIAWLEKQKESHYTKRNALFDECVKNYDPDVMKKVSHEVDEMLHKEQESVESHKRNKPKESWLSKTKYEIEHADELLIQKQEELREIRELKKQEQKPAEKQDYSGLNDLERAILRGFLSAGVENVPVTIIKETAKECIAQMKPVEWSDEDKAIVGCIACCLDGQFVTEAARKQYLEWFNKHRRDFLNTHHTEWSEEDEKVYKMLSSMIHGTFVVETQETQDKLLSWLKSLTLNLKKKNEDITKLCSNEWSEEDEGELQNAIDALEFLGKKGVYKSESGYDAALQAASWLKNLLERFNLQSKQEWSDGNKQWFDAIIKDYEDSLSCDEDHDPAIQIKINLLKSLYLQSYWKPTEEQMKALERTIRLANFGLEEDRRKALVSLYEQLKKLL